MYEHGLYGYKSPDGEIKASVLEWSHTDETGSVDLSDYGNKNTAKALVDLSMTDGLLTPSMAHKDFFIMENRFWVPDFIRTTPDNWNDIHLFACDSSQIDDVIGFCAFAKERTGGYFDYSFDLGLTVSPCYKLIYRSSIDWRQDSQVFASLNEMLDIETENLSQIFRKDLGFAYIYSEFSEKWSCYSLKDEPKHINEADRWNEHYETNVSSKDFSASIEKFDQEVENITEDFLPHFVNGFNLLEEIEPLIYDICGLEGIDEFLDGITSR